MHKIGVEYVVLLLVGGVTLLTLTGNPFEQVSPPDNPAYMETAVNADFGEALTLLGYTLENSDLAPGEWVDVVLYWRAQQNVPGDRYRAIVQIVDYRQTEAWAVSERFHIGVNPDEIHTPDVFASDRHTMRVFEHVLPYTGWLTVQLINNQTDQAVQLADGTDTLTLTPIRILGDGPTVEQRLDYVIGGAVSVRCVSTVTADDQLQVEVYWHVLAPPEQPDTRVMLHGLDSAGEIIANGDRPPLNGDYPPVAWQAGQTLHDHFTLPDANQIESIRLGMYTPDGARLTVTDAGSAVTDNAVVLPVDLPTCAGG